ncbi:SRPBCC family protein [Rhodoplanes sp. Z2-YC6860]|uniref:SRPBCC family protein n=1 Tax=Rhodoplanes sp. Z2-YC6860 TaxID=674703 RepID=UPI00078B4096|nr:SRPBCC family protein [Rhodoplanes sp. Z2-YC6860]AMN42974.1 activator of Hsp90 ATPase 1 family protein [Rhodoplanes sp. Z2-YC6860]
MDIPRLTTVSRIIMVPPDAVYRAYLDRDAVVEWLPPGSMTGELHAFEPREGGRFSMSLVYPESETEMRGKTTERSDRFEGRFVKLVPNKQIVWAVVFDSNDPSFAGEMTVATTLAPAGQGTEVTIRCAGIPPGVRLEDNEAGSRLTLDQLAKFLGG